MVRICDSEQREPRNSPWLFSFSWEQRRLSHYLETSNEKNTEDIYGIDDVLSVSGDFGVVNQIEFQGRSFAGASVAGYGILHTGEVVYTKSPLKSAPYGIIKTNQGKTGIVSVLYGVYHPRENLQPELVQIYFEQNARLNNYLRPLVNKGAKNTLLISDDDALQGEVIFPKAKSEQQKICSFFRHLDDLITLHQCKYFYSSPKSGIFHNEKTNAWEQRKLGEMAVFSKGYGYSKNDLQESGTPIILYGRLYTKYKTIIDEVDTFVADRKGSIYSKGGEVIVPASGETAEDIAIASVVEHKDVILGGDLNVISPLAGLCSPFLALTISHGKPHCDLAKKAQGKSVVHLHNTDLQEIDIFYPSTREQTQIGIFFRSLDDLIALHQRE